MTRFSVLFFTLTHTHIYIAVKAKLTSAPCDTVFHIHRCETVSHNAEVSLTLTAIYMCVCVSVKNNTEKRVTNINARKSLIINHSKL